MWVPVVLGVIVMLVGWAFVTHLQRQQRQRRIEQFRFPDAIVNKVSQAYPHLGEGEVSRVMDGLRDYFLVCNLAGRRMVAMPSQAVDLAWHEFILHTRLYQLFCRRSLGRFLHHMPAEAMRSPTQAQEGIKRAWRVSCLREGINPQSPSRLPLLFALDDELNIPDGFRYSLDCKRGKGDGYCAGHIGCSSGCGGGCTGDSGCSGGCGGGD